MAHSVRDFTGGLDRFEVDAPTVRVLLAELEARYPGLEAHVRETMVIGVDGELQPGIWDLPLAQDSEVVFVPLVAGG